MRFRFLSRASGIFATITMLAGCGGSSASFTPRTPASSNVDLLGLATGTKQFGVGLGDSVGIAGGLGFLHQWCDGVSGYFMACGEVAGTRKFSDRADDTQKLTCSGGKTLGSVTVKFGAVQQIGIGSYLMSGDTQEKFKCGRDVGAGSQLVGGSWDDVLYISSGSLKKGSPVTIGVQWSLTPQTTHIACDAAQNSYGNIELYNAGITPPAGYSEFSITGACVGSTFEYFLYGSAKQQGTTAVGTISTSVGASLPIYFAISGDVIACQTTNYCVGNIGASLSGKYKFTITSITPGATYRTASGNKYQ
ncbi:MAG: hypothetical protein JO113_03905 [Candidatus Eremiobacteraeota bacterium]|nr:hypothetical protein [Candidatus Eremiobacteraeota bacterium]